jgi:hypothetical protein
VADRLRIGAGSLTTVGIINQTKDPKKLLIVDTCTNASTSYHRFWTTLPFYGVLYLPNAYLNLENGGQIHGAISAANVNFADDANVHYDTSLRTATFSCLDTPYVVTEWRELTDPAERVPLP